MTETAQNPLAVVESHNGVAALLSPLRQQILDSLHSEADSATGLSRKLGISRQKINYHVRALEKTGLLELEGETQRRGCTERRLRATARAYLVKPDLLNVLGTDIDTLRDRFSSSYLIELAARTVGDVAELRRGADEAGKKLATLALQVDVKFRSPEDRAAFADELTDKVAELAGRYHDHSPESRAFRFVIGSHPIVKKKEKKERIKYNDPKN